MSYQFLRSSARPVLLLAPLLASVAVGAEPSSDGHFVDLRLGISSAPAPEVSESIGGTGYDWNDVNTQGVQGSLGVAFGTAARSWGGTVGEIDLVVASYDITPGSVRRDDGTDFAPGASGLKNQTLGIQVGYGYHWASSPSRKDLALHLEIMPFIGGGMATAETSGENTGGANASYEDTGTYYEYGARIGMYLSERNVILGLTFQYAAGSSDIDIDLGGATSKLSLDRNGFGVGFLAGWRL